MKYINWNTECPLSKTFCLLARIQIGVNFIALHDGKDMKEYFKPYIF